MGGTPSSELGVESSSPELSLGSDGLELPDPSSASSLLLNLAVLVDLVLPSGKVSLVLSFGLGDNFTPVVLGKFHIFIVHVLKFLGEFLVLVDGLVKVLNKLLLGWLILGGDWLLSFSKNFIF